MPLGHCDKKYLKCIHFSLDDAEMMLTKMEPLQKKIRLSLKDTRRAFTYDNEAG